jgi:hypothetical protein
MTEKESGNDKEECGNDTKEFFLGLGEVQGGTQSGTQAIKS